jgi:hypothetical protein
MPVTCSIDRVSVETAEFLSEELYDIITRGSARLGQMPPEQAQKIENELQKMFAGLKFQLRAHSLKEY